MTNIFDSNVLVVDQSDKQRARGIKEALLMVVVKVSGQANAGKNKVIKRALGGGSHYLQEFSYSASDKTVDVEVDGQLITQPLIQLNVGFSQKAVTDLLRKAGLPIWSNNRPSVLVWLVVDDGANRFFSNQTDDKTQGLFREKMKQRGLPGIFPLLDLQDQMNINVKEVWQLDYDSLFKASHRYDSDSILAGKVAKISSGQWRGTWHYLFQGQTFLIESTADELSIFLDDGIDGVVSFLSQRYAIDTLAAGGTMYLDVEGVSQFSNYVQITRYLEDLEPVRSLAVESVNEDKVNYRLLFEGEIRLVQEIIELGDIIELVENVGPELREGGGFQQRYHYRASQQ